MPGSAICDFGTTSCVEGGPIFTSACKDGLDNDGNGDIDCDDAGCDGLACEVAGAANSALCDFGDGKSCEEVHCMDGIDNDGDSVTDCADPDCVGVPPC